MVELNGHTNGEFSEKGEKVSRDEQEQDVVRNESITTAERRARGSVASTAADRARRNVNMKISNPLGGFTEAELRVMGSDYAKMHAIADPEDIRAFELGAILAQNPQDWSRIRNHATPEEMAVLEKEFKSRWSQPFLLYLVIILCSTCAAVQGMGEFSIRLGIRLPSC
jgi:hypothetical protein